MKPTINGAGALAVTRRLAVIAATLLITALSVASFHTPALAQEETDRIQVTGRKFSLREIIERCHEGERTKLGERRDVVYTMTMRNIARWKRKTRTEESVFRAYADRDGHNRTVLLDRDITVMKLKDDQWVEDTDEDQDPPPVRVTTSGIEEFERIPFFLEEVHEFDFELLERKREDGHMIFKIAFKPRSSFKPLPSGVVYVDTDNYRIVHEEFRFDRNPFPLFLSDVKRVSRHWGMMPGGEWVFTRLMAEVEMRTGFFGRIPKNLSFSLERSDFAFDGGYDSRLFGEDDAPEPPATDPAISQRPPADTLVTPSPFLSRLQQTDRDFYPPDLLEVNPMLRSQAVSLHDSLGLTGLEDVMDRRASAFQFRPGLASDLWRFNRVEGFVAGLGADLRTRPGRDGPRLSVQGAWAFGSEKFRHREALELPLWGRRWQTGLRADYRDRVEPYGSNRPALNSVRALFGGADEQDYLRARGGGAGLFVRRTGGVAFNARFESERHTSEATTTKFSVLGDLWETNTPIDEGDERSVVARIDVPSDARVYGFVEQRVAGGDLGGDFSFAQTRAEANWWHYWFGGHELNSRARFTHTEGTPPVQRLADAGGLSSVRGYSRRSLLGQSALALRFEYLVPYDVFAATRMPVFGTLGMQVVPWFDAARTWEGTSEEWIHSAGVGLQVFLGVFGKASNLRLDLAFPTAADAPEDFRAYLRFAAGRL